MFWKISPKFSICQFSKKANFPSVKIEFFIETKILIDLLYFSAVIAVIQGKLKIENFSMKANLDRHFYDSQLGLYLDPYCLY